MDHDRTVVLHLEDIGGDGFTDTVPSAPVEIHADHHVE